jgi:hypothetical protein
MEELGGKSHREKIKKFGHPQIARGMNIEISIGYLFIFVGVQIFTQIFTTTI